MYAQSKYTQKTSYIFKARQHSRYCRHIKDIYENEARQDGRLWFCPIDIHVYIYNFSSIGVFELTMIRQSFAI